jgi:hypothetical protein
MPQVAEPNVLAGSLSFFDRLGVFDVLLPFILVFTIVYAILEKTKIYGLEKVQKGDKTVEVTRKNLNAMTAFCTAFFVVASSQLVAVINETLAHTVLILLLLLSFMLLVGSFHSGKEEFSLDQHPGWKKAFMILVFIAIILVFANATGFLPVAYSYVMANWNGTVVASIGLIVVIIAFMVYVTHGQSVGEEKKSS